MHYSIVNSFSFVNYSSFKSFLYSSQVPSPLDTLEILSLLSSNSFLPNIFFFPSLNISLLYPSTLSPSSLKYNVYSYKSTLTTRWMLSRLKKPNLLPFLSLICLKILIISSSTCPLLSSLIQLWGYSCSSLNVSDHVVYLLVICIFNLIMIIILIIIPFKLFI